MHYLTNVEMTIDSKEARLSQAVQDFFIAKMVPYNDAKKMPVVEEAKPPRKTRGKAAKPTPKESPMKKAGDLLAQRKTSKEGLKINPEPESVERATPYDKNITEHNGGVEPPRNKGGLEVPEIDWTQGKDKAAIRLSTDTMERNVEKIFGKQADKINEFLVEPTRHNETLRVEWANKVRADTKAVVVDKLGIKPGSVENRLVQQYGEGRISLDELKEKSPQRWEDITKAADYFRKVYDEAINKWNFNRSQAGMKPIGKLQNYFRHFVDLGGWVKQFGFNFTEGGLPTAISGITEYFKSQTPWASAAMRRVGSTFTDDALGGLDNFIDNTSKAIFHTDSVQRGRLLEKYLREAASAKPNDVKLANFASNLNDWTNLVSGKQARLDRAIESVIGRPSLAFMRQLTRRFGANVIGGNISAAVTHAIPMVYTLATTDYGASFKGAIDTLHSPFMQDFKNIDGQVSQFLTRRYGTEEIVKTTGEKVASVISSPFHLVDQFISRLAVSGKYFEKVAAGMDPAAAMRAADNYAGRVIGDRSAGNLPNLMNTKTLGWLTQFQIEVNDNLHVLAHDVPKWSQGDVTKIAHTFIKFAVYSYMFNQAMQYIKGSGKGLDPIDLGLTLAGINDEGRDQTLQQRLALVAGDLAKELPFTSIPTGGQIPALQPLQTAAGQVAAGQPVQAAEGVAASFLSPVGGGQQVQKSLTAIQAWRQGFVTDSTGKVTAKVPQDYPTLIQGVLFGKSAFDSVKKSSSEMTALSATIKQDQAASKMKDTQARNIWTQLQGMPKDQAEQQLQQIAQTDPDMAKRVIAAAKAAAEGMTKTDTMLKSLGVQNGARSEYIVTQLKGMSSNAQKEAYLLDLANKGILTSAVMSQVASQMQPAQ